MATQSTRVWLRSVVALATVLAAMLPSAGHAETVAGDYGGPLDTSSVQLDVQKDSGLTPDAADVWTPTGSVKDWGLPNACWYQACSDERVACFNTEGCKELMACSKALQETTCAGSFSAAAITAHAAFMVCGKDVCGPKDFDSCSGRCGSYYGTWVSCECDPACAIRKDCCSDFATCPTVPVQPDVAADAAEVDAEVDGTDREAADAQLLLDAADDGEPGRVVASDRDGCQAQRVAGGAGTAWVMLFAATWLASRRHAKAPGRAHAHEAAKNSPGRAHAHAAGVKERT